MDITPKENKKLIPPGVVQICARTAEGWVRLEDKAALVKPKAKEPDEVGEQT